jgi:superfamily II DNA/RNA helicase
MSQCDERAGARSPHNTNGLIFLSDTPETDAEHNTAPQMTAPESQPDAAPDETVAPEAAAAAEAEAVTVAAAEAPAAEAPSAPEMQEDEPQAAVDSDAADEPPAEGFGALGLSEPILRALHDKGYLRPTPIQAQAIPTVLMGRDVLGCAQTGTGKTAGFTLPLLDILSGSRARARMPRSLILEPTRELALQVAENFVAYGKYLKLNHALLIGGESMSDQKDALTKGVDVLIATPGRLIDLFERGGLLLTDVRVLVIDEADRMLDMGFIPDIERIVAMLPRTRQTLFFSATMAPEIRRLADAFLNNPKEITVSKPASVATTITSGLVLVNEHDKREALRRLIRSEDVQNALIFCNRKRDVDILLKSLLKHGFSAGALHGDLPQSVRFATLEKFKANELRLLVCSDVAARGIDIGGLSHVFNFDVPHHAEDYVHRIGRTGRAGKEGRAFTIATPDDRLAVEAVETLIAAPIPRIEIPGLDIVEWAEGDAKRGRGRGRGKPVAKAPRPAPRGEAAAPPRERERGRDGERERARDGSERERARDGGERERARDGGERERARAEPRREAPARGEPRAPREPRTVYATDNTGPAVRGFGTDIPAFMLIRKRGPLSAILEEPVESDEDDVINEPNGDEDMAA